MKQKELEQEAKHMAEERRKYTLKTVKEETKKELGENKSSLDALNTDDEVRRNMRHGNFGSWRESRGTEEIEKRLRRRKQKLNACETWLRKRGQLSFGQMVVLSTKAAKDKNKFLHKYYYWGAFFMAENGETSAHPPWRIISTKPFFPKSCRSRTLGALVPNTPTLCIRTPSPLT